jgi:hypothetical protein
MREVERRGRSILVRVYDVAKLDCATFRLVLEYRENSAVKRVRTVSLR